MPNTSGERQLRPAILSIGTAVPKYYADQISIGQWMASSFVDRPATQRLIRNLYACSGIDKRYTCAPEYLLPPTESHLAPGLPRKNTQTTAERMATYERESVPLGIKAVHQALARFGARAKQSEKQVASTITHLIVISCTGFFAPGLDFMLAQELGLSLTVNRIVIGFMGCSAAFNGLRTANEIVNGFPQARVLIVCVELGSLHIQSGERRDDLVSAALFGDGAAAALVGRPDPDDHGYYAIDDFHTSVKPETQDEMVWRIGNHGFELRLSPRIPAHLAAIAPNALNTLTGGVRPAFWAIHPGGRTIVERLQEIFDLTEDDVAASRTTLRNFGNLSSATILFVLDEEMRRRQSGRHDSQEDITGIAMAFGPGLSIEMAQLTLIPNRNATQPTSPAV